MIPVGAGPDGPIAGGGAMFIAMNRNKLGMTLDPAAPKGREIVKKLVATADIVVANLPPRVLRSLALDLDSLRQVKPDIILNHRRPGFGAGGRLSHEARFPTASARRCRARSALVERGRAATIATSVVPMGSISGTAPFLLGVPRD